VPGGASDQEIAALGDTLGIALPGDLQSWLRLNRGDVIGPGGVFGIRPNWDFVDITSRLADYPGWLERGWLPVAGDGCGNFYVLETTGPLAGFVGFVDTISDPDGFAYVAASGLWQFMCFLLEAERDDYRSAWPFDRKYVLTQDPNLATAPSELQP
jgi:hypothetical protein